MKPAPTANKLRGGYYTPGPIADFLVDWAIRSPDARVLEPSAGDGVFLRSAARRILGLGGPDTSVGMTAIEVDRTAAQEARWALAPVGAAESVIEGDFFSFAEANEGTEMDKLMALADQRLIRTHPQRKTVRVVYGITKEQERAMVFHKQGGPGVEVYTDMNFPGGVQEGLAELVATIDQLLEEHA